MPGVGGTYSVVGVSARTSIATTPGVSVAAGMAVASSAGTLVAVVSLLGVAVARAGGWVGANVSAGVSPACTTNALPSIGVTSGLGTFASAQSCSWARILLTIEASVGLRIANNARKPINKTPVPINKMGSQFLPCLFSTGMATAV